MKKITTFLLTLLLPLCYLSAQELKTDKTVFDNARSAISSRNNKGRF